MSENRRKALIRYGSAVICGLLVGGIYLYCYDFLNQDLRNMYRLLSDAFLLPGFLMVASGAMIWLANEGTLDGLTYVLTRAVRFLIPFGRGTKDENYGQYKARQREKQITGYGFLFTVGAGFLAFAVLFLILFYL